MPSGKADGWPFWRALLFPTINISHVNTSFLIETVSKRVGFVQDAGGIVCNQQIGGVSPPTPAQNLLLWKVGTPVGRLLSCPFSSCAHPFHRLLVRRSNPLHIQCH